MNRAAGDECRPKLGDVTVCIRCLGVAEVGAGNLLVKLDFAKLSAEELAQVQRLQSAVLLARTKEQWPS